jgi:hypothetical protein
MYNKYDVQVFDSTAFQNLPKLGCFGMKIYHLAILSMIMDRLLFSLIFYRFLQTGVKEQTN